MEEKMKDNPLSFQLKLKPEDFLPATEEEKQSQVIMRESVGFWKDGFRRLRKNKVAMVSLIVIVLVMIFSFIVPAFYPYTYKEQIKGANNLAPMEYSQEEQARIDAGEKVFPHIFGTDKMGRDYAIRVMMGSRISLLVGLIATAIILVIGSAYGSIAAFFGGTVDLVMMRIVDIIYTVPDILLIVLLSFTLKVPLTTLGESVPGFHWVNVVGENLISIFIVFALLYWVGMARMVRSQVLMLKESEYVTAARALGVGNGRIIKKHLLTNCIGTLIVTTTLQIPSSIFTESFLSFLGLGVAVPLPSLGSLASDAINGMQTYPYLLFIPALLISLIILSFNLFGDGLRDAFDPKLKN
jgi:oligopeptide transport system permease protein